MRIKDVLESVEEVDELFDLFGLEPDRHVLAIYRLHIFKRFGVAASEIDQREPPATEDVREALYAEALRDAYDHYANGRGAGASPFAGVDAGLIPLRLRKSTGS